MHAQMKLFSLFLYMEQNYVKFDSRGSTKLELQLLIIFGIQRGGRGRQTFGMET